MYLKRIKQQTSTATNRRKTYHSNAVRFDPVGPEPVLQERPVCSEQVPQLGEGEWSRHILHVEDVAGRVGGRGRRASCGND